MDNAKYKTHVEFNTRRYCGVKHSVGIFYSKVQHHLFERWKSRCQQYFDHLFFSFTNEVVEQPASPACSLYRSQMKLKTAASSDWSNTIASIANIILAIQYVFILLAKQQSSLVLHKIVQYLLVLLTILQYLLVLQYCNTFAIPCELAILRAIPCNTMQYHDK